MSALMSRPLLRASAIFLSTSGIRPQLFHLFEFSSSRWAIVKADDVFAHLRGADKGAEVEAHPLFFEALEKLIERAPVNRQVIALVEIFVLFDQAIVGGRDGFALTGD